MSEEHPPQAADPPIALSPPSLESTSFRALFFWLTALLLMALALWGGWFGPPGEHAGRFIGLWLLFGAASVCLLILLPEEWTPKRRLWTILALSFACRLALLPHPASDDVNRYVWEGRVFAQGFSPYVHPPDDPLLAELRDEAIWPGINHKEQAGCYPPLMLLLFSALSLIQYGFLPVKVMVIA
jgi:hypothetical protein